MCKKTVIQDQIKNNNDILVSVQMPCHNCEKYLPEAIESILNQTHTNFEFIIIDDCSTDNSWNIIQNYAKQDKRIFAYRNKTNLKIVRTRNRALELMNGSSKYVAIFDSDDISMPDRLKKEVEFLEENPDFGIVSSHILIIDENSKEIGKRLYETNPHKLHKKLFLKSPAHQPASMIRRSVLDKVGWYDDKGKFDRSRDFELWTRIGLVSKIKNLDEFLLKYRVTKTQGKWTHLRETLASTIQVQIKGLPVMFSFTLVAYILLESILLLLPKSFVFWLFKKVSYK